MGFQPTIPLSGIAGWRFLQKTQQTQQAAFEKGPELAREIKYFKENIGKVETAEDLMKDRRLLKVALGAFGLEQDIDKKAYIRKVLEDGTFDPRSFANRLSEPGYLNMSAAFGFGDPGLGRTGDKGFADKIIESYKTRAFEVAVGDANDNLRFAMNFRREMQELSKGADGGSWFSVLGSKPLRKVFESAFNLPTSFGQIDVDRQRDVLREKSRAMFGTDKLTAFADPANVEKMIERFLAREQINEGFSANTPGSTALTLLQSANSNGSLGLSNFLAARR